MSKVKKMLSILITFIVVFLVARLVCAPLTRIKEKKSFTKQSTKVEIISHRGGSLEWPENTLFAFEQTSKLGVPSIELDTHITKDGVIVILHDETLERTTNGKGNIKDMTYDEISLLDAGYNFTKDGGQTFPYRGKGITIPTLEEVLKIVPDMKWIIEVKEKDGNYEEQLVNLVKRYNLLDKVCFASSNQNVISKIRKIEPSVATNMPRNEIRLIMGLYYTKLLPFFKPSGAALQVPMEHGGYKVVLSKDWVKTMQEKGFVVQVWTINDESEMRKLIDWGVDGILTDRPTFLKDLLNNVN